MREEEIPTRAEVVQWLIEAPEGYQEEWVAACLDDRVGDSRLEGRGEVIRDKILSDLNSYEEYV